MPTAARAPCGQRFCPEAGSRPRFLPSARPCNSGPIEMDPATPATGHWPSCESLPVPVDELDRGNAAHVTTPWLKATFYPPARSVVPRRREPIGLSWSTRMAIVLVEALATLTH